MSATMKQIIMAAIALFMLTGPVPVHSEDQPADAEAQKRYLYQWTDRHGTVHITDGLGKVPERYRDKARKMESVKGQDPDREQQMADQPAESDAAEAEAEAKAEWQYKMREWRTRLANAEKEKRALEQEKEKITLTWGSAAGAPPTYRQRTADIDRQLQDLQADIDRAKNMLRNVLPDEARKAGVPPGWLRD